MANSRQRGKEADPAVLRPAWASVGKCCLGTPCEYQQISRLAGLVCNCLPPQQISREIYAKNKHAEPILYRSNIQYIISIRDRDC